MSSGNVFSVVDNVNEVGTNGVRVSSRVKSVMSGSPLGEFFICS